MNIRMNNKINIRNFMCLVLGLFLSGCLVTRQAVREGVSGQPLTPEQQVRANNEVRYQETDEQMRSMLGRIESVENSMNILNANKSGSQMEALTERKDLQEKLKIYEEAIVKLEAQYLALAQKLEVLQASGASTSTASTKSSGTKSSYDLAAAEYDKKRWKEAIVSFEKYRSSNPSGKHYAEATYKIGSSFHELGMKTEAKAFYSEAVEKYPKSEWAKKSRSRLKTLK